MTVTTTEVLRRSGERGAHRIITAVRLAEAGLPIGSPVELTRPLYRAADGVYCWCGQIIVDTPDGRWIHVGLCEHCPGDGEPCPEMETVHVGGHTPVPVDCAHEGWGCGYAQIPNSCQHGHDHCCGCCQADG